MIEAFSVLNLLLIGAIAWFYVGSRMEPDYQRAVLQRGVAKYMALGWFMTVGIATTLYFLADSVWSCITYLYSLIQ